jgi:hypothetical protein
MQKLKLIPVLSMLMLGVSTHAQNPDAINQYIITYKDLAIAEMQRSGVPASITLAQGIYESTAGTSDLVLESNNHFGIKCRNDWTGEWVKHDDDLKGEHFRKYPTAADSYRDHSDFLRNSPRYASLFTLDPTDYMAWAYGLKKAGYATSPKYPQALIKLIDTYNLGDYTLIAMGKKISDGSNTVAAVSTEPANSNPSSSLPAETVSDENIKADYPEGIFKINEVKVIYAKVGTSYLSIARQYDVDLSKIFEYNEIQVSEMTAQDQLIFLQRKNKMGNHEFHLVQANESIHDIAQVEGVRTENLVEMNSMRAGENPEPGEQLVLIVKKKSIIPKFPVKNNNSVSRNRTK